MSVLHPLYGMIKQFRRALALLYDTATIVCGNLLYELIGELYICVHCLTIQLILPRMFIFVCLFKPLLVIRFTLGLRYQLMLVL